MIVSAVNNDGQVETPASSISPQLKVVLPDEDLSVNISDDNSNLLNSSSSPPGSPQASDTDNVIQEMVENLVVESSDGGSDRDSNKVNLSREYLGKCIQFFTGHGWWNKHLKLTKLGNTSECRLCYEDDESPIHIFSECVAMVATRQELFNSPFPTQQLGRMSLCQVAELALVDSVRDLTDIDQDYSNVSLSE